MKFIPLNNLPNISSSRFDSVSPSMQLDSRGFPHIVWLENKFGHNEVHYSFWDGLQWASKSSETVDWSKDSISLSRSGIVFENDAPVLAYIKRDTNSTSLNVAVSNGMSWDISSLYLPYDCLWAGISKSSRGMTYTSSSSSSIDSSSSSSSSSSSGYVNSSSSSSQTNSSSSQSRSSSSSSSSSQSISSSSSQSMSSSSSSSQDSSSSSSSSSVDSNSSSSSSSYDDSNIVVSTYDGSTLRMYSFSNGIFKLLSEDNFNISNYSYMKMVGCGNYVGIVVSENSGIAYNFFHVDNEMWKFSSFQEVSESGSDIVLDFDTSGYGFEEDGVMQIAWLKDTYSNLYVMKTQVDSYGIFTSEIADEKVKNVQSGQFISGGFSKISIDTNSFLNSRILCLGAQSALYEQISSTQWTSYAIDIDGIGQPFNPLTLALKIYSEDGSEYVKLSFCNDNSDIYYFESNGEDGLDESYPNMVVLNSERVFVADWDCGLLSGNDIDYTFYTRIGDMLRESINKTLVVLSEGEDPDYNTSSSSSSSSSIEYSSSSSSSSSSSVGNSSSSSSSSEQYSSSSSSSEQYSSSSSSSVDSSSSSSIDSSSSSSSSA